MFEQIFANVHLDEVESKIATEPLSWSSAVQNEQQGWRFKLQTKQSNYVCN